MLRFFKACEGEILARFYFLFVSITLTLSCKILNSLVLFSHNLLRRHHEGFKIIFSAGRLVPGSEDGTQLKEDFRKYLRK